MTLFLDFDGVLHPEYCVSSLHFIRLPALEALLREYPHVQVVISSTWRQQFQFEHILSRFSTDITKKIVGATPVFSSLKHVPDRLLGYPRHAECWEWQREHCGASEAWIALDDRPWLFYPMCPELIQVDGSHGLDDDVLRQLSARLDQFRYSGPSSAQHP